MSNKMILALLVPGTGAHVAAWRDKQTPVGKELDLDFYKSVAVSAEREGYDFILFADSLHMDVAGPEAGRRYPRHPHLDFEPLTLLSALAAVISTVGLAATVSTTYSHAFSTARAFASLDHLSKGRAAWKIGMAA